jgi:hypothetical protein
MKLHQFKMLLHNKENTTIKRKSKVFFASYSLDKRLICIIHEELKN